MMMAVALSACTRKADTTSTVTTTTEAVEQPKNAKTKKILKTAKSIYQEQPEYSMDKRMLEGYVDCSSYVWRCYQSVDISLGDETYAPTAADMASWCEDNQCLFSGDEQKDLLEPGDLVFYAKRKGSNGRYRNIAHVAIYVGNGKILHADGSSPAYGKVLYRPIVAVEDQR
jgi:cell wall-associated NlpC family hydrolase